MSERKGGPLEGLKILDMTRVLSGPLATSWLSDMGASVIKVEDPNGGDSTRGVDGYCNYFATFNRNKRCVTLNLKDPKGKEMFLELVKKSDVVAENFRPGTMEKLGLGFDVLRSVNEKIVLASISGYGQTGPYSHRPGYDVVGQAMGGIMSLTGEADGRPLKCGPSIGDTTAGMNMVVGILAALYRVNATGKGERVEVSLVDSVLALCSADYVKYAETGELPKRWGNDYGGWCPYGGGFEAVGGYFNIGVGTDKHWQLFCEKVIGRPELGTDPRFINHEARVEHRAETNKLVADWCIDLPIKEAVETLNKAGVPAAQIYDFADIRADENFTVHRQMIKQLADPVVGEFSYVNTPNRFLESGLVEPRPAGKLGQYNEEVYGEYLGLSPAEVAELKKNGTI